MVPLVSSGLWRGLQLRRFADNPQGLLLLFEGERVTICDSADSLSVPADGEEQELAGDGVHASVGFAMKDYPYWAHEWITAAHDVFISGQQPGTVAGL